MIFIDRSDGKKIRQRHPLNAIMPYMMPGRNESAVYYERQLDMENALRHIKAKNNALRKLGDDAEPERADIEGNYSLFALVLAAAVRTIALRPELNRFIHGRALYQRNHIALSFIVKQKMTEEAPEANAKVFFDPDDTLENVTRKVNKAINSVRESGEAEGERIAKFAQSIPGGRAVMIGAYKFLDRLNLAPRALIKADPLYASAYFANLGSIGLDAPYHHLYEWGNASIFVVMGKLAQREIHHGPYSSKRHFMEFKVTIDERISEGLYFARSASIFTRLIGNPELLDRPLAELEALLSGADEIAEGAKE